MSKSILALLVVVFILIFFGEVVAVHEFFASDVLGAADFHSRWYGGRALLLEHRDPYSPEITAEIEEIRDPEGERLNSFSFAFPLHVLFTFWPLTYFSFDWAQSIWMVMLQWLVIAISVLLIVMVGWKPSPLGLGGILLGSLLFYPAARTIILGQFTLHVTFFLLLSLYFLRQNRDWLAGFWLAATSIKPQMVILIGLWLVVWAVFNRRNRFLFGVVGGGLAMLFGSMIWLPQWPISFIKDLQQYASVASGRNPLEVLGEMVFPTSPGIIVFLAAGILILLTFYAWYWGLNFEPKIKQISHSKEVGAPTRNIGNDNNNFKVKNRFEWVLFWTMSVSLLLWFQTGSTNQVLLIIPLFFWLWTSFNRWNSVLVIFLAVGFVFGPWFLFLTTRSGDYENPLLLLPLPFICLIVLGMQAWGSGSRLNKNVIVDPGG